MKPDKIILIRHGESCGNVDRQVYAHTPDYALQLTTLGRRQAAAVGDQIKNIIRAGSSVQFYVSPFWRTRQTYEEVSKKFRHHEQQVYEDPRLREQEWGTDFRKWGADWKGFEDRRDSYGHFYYRLPNGESCADVFDRVSAFLNTLHRDFEKPKFPRNVIIVTHGMTMRLFLMRWFHMPVEQFEVLANPLNCEYYVLTRNLNSHHYTLTTEPRIHKLKHKFQYPLKKLCPKIRLKKQNPPALRR